VNRTKFEVLSLRIVFVSLIGFIGAILQPFALPVVASGLFGAAAALLAVFLGVRLRRASPQALLAGFTGTAAGGLLGLLFVYIGVQAGLPTGTMGQFVRLALPLAGAYVGLSVALANAETIPFDLSVSAKTSDASSSSKLLDTSVLIDGRIVDIAESGFMEGRLIVPRFVLHELQLVADSSDSAKRNRGRRGLDVVQLLQKLPRIRLEVSTEDFPETREVDLKLIELAKLWRAKIVTNDFNLNKLAQVQGLTVLNINELANSLKPVVLPGEVMGVHPKRGQRTQSGRGISG
jgi:uncharacterized protein YacL